MKELHEIMINEISADIQLFLDEKMKRFNGEDVEWRLLQKNNKMWLVSYDTKFKDMGGCVYSIDEIEFSIKTKSTSTKTEGDSKWLCDQLGFKRDSHNNSNRRKGKGDDGITPDDGGMPIQIIKV